MEQTKYPIVVIGGSIAAISFIRTLRQNQNQDKILLVYGEDRLPYKRTKINKNMVRGFDKDEFIIADENWYAENNVELLNDWATRINRESREIEFKSDRKVTFDKLLIATGSGSVVPRLAGVERDEIHNVQNASDVERLLDDSKNKRRFLIIGGGVESIETADQLVRKGKEVILVGRMLYPMQKLFPKEMIDPLEKAMLNKGMQWFPGVSISSIDKNGEVYSTKIKGESKEFDVIVACTGAVPNISLAKVSDIKSENGIVVDKWLRTSDKNILAAGDVAQHSNGIVTGLWHAAEHQGKLAALNLYEDTEAHTLPPYRLKVCVFGLYLFSAAYEKVIPGQFEMVKEEEGDVKRILYFKNGLLEACIMLNDGNRAKQYQQALMEHWDKEKVFKEMPIKPALSFSFGTSV